MVAALPAQSATAPVSPPWENPYGVVNPWHGIGEIGLGWCRCGGGATPLGSWNVIEAEGPGRFNWSASDSDLAEWLEKNRLTPVPILCYTPSWASSGPGGEHTYPPRDLFDYYRFVRAQVLRYKGRVPAYEVWNEPNGRGVFFGGGVDQLVAMTKMAYCAVKQADGEAVVLFPGQAGIDVEFVRRCYELGAGDYFDVMAAHPYQWSRTFDEGYHSADRIAALRGVMDAMGDRHKPIWLNEFGWSVEGEISEADQARLLAIAMTFFRSFDHCGVERLFWYNAKSWGENYGLHDGEGRRQASFYAYKLIVEHLSAKRFIGRIAVEGGRAFVFADDAQPANATIVVWSPTLETVGVELPVRPATEVQIVRLDGSRETVRHEAGQLKLDATPEPRFLNLPRAAVAKIEPAKPARVTEVRRDEKQNSFVWAQIVVPQTTHRAYLSHGSGKLAVAVYNCTDGEQEGWVKLVCPTIRLSRQMPYRLAPLSSTVLEFPVQVPSSVKADVYPILVRGEAGGKPISSYKDTIRISAGQAIEFTGNSWIESRYLKSSPAGGPSVSFADRIEYGFDLSGCRKANFTLHVGAHAGGPWKVQLSGGDEDFVTMAEGRSWPGVHRFAVPAEHLNRAIRLRIDGENCQLYHLLLETTPSETDAD